MRDELPGVAISRPLSASDNGVPAYVIPIQAPPGTAGLSPALSLTYVGVGNDSFVGHGWDLTGLSSISRGPRKPDVDGEPSVPTLTQTDALYLDGGRLLQAKSGRRTYSIASRKITHRSELGTGQLTGPVI